MRIEHIAIWTNELNRLKDFYLRYFQATAGKKYYNPGKQFESYFLSFSNGARLELMSAPDIQGRPGNPSDKLAGLTHISFSCGNQDQVDLLTERIRNDGYQVLVAPHHTGDGCYESVVLDPDGNQIEITL